MMHTETASSVITCLSQLVSYLLVAAIFTVMCYNVLCDKYATRQLYGYCPSWALNWEYRKKGIMEEITNCDADIISLQVSEGPSGHKLDLS